jgi:hypothetical protein
LKELEAAKSNSAAIPFVESAEAAALQDSRKTSEGAQTKAGAIAVAIKKLATQPITWFGLAGWAVVVLLLFRKPSV